MTLQSKRTVGALIFAAVALSLPTVPVLFGPPPTIDMVMQLWNPDHVCRLIEARSDPKDPEIVMWAQAIKNVTRDPVMQARLALTVTLTQIQYARDEQVWGTLGAVHTLDEIRRRAVENQWPLIRTDCKGQALVLFSLTQALGIESHVSARRFSRRGAFMGQGHAWVSAKLDGQWRELNDNRIYSPATLEPLLLPSPFIFQHLPELLALNVVNGAGMPLRIRWPIDWVNWPLRLEWSIAALPLSLLALLASNTFRSWWASLGNRKAA